MIKIRIFTILLTFGLAILLRGCQANNGNLHHRRHLTHESNIANALTEELESGIMQPRFTLTAEFSGENLFTSHKPFQIDVVLTNPSIDEKTTFSIDGEESSFENSTLKFLVADKTGDKDSNNGLVILVVDENNGSVSGIVQKDSKLVKFEQVLGGAATVTETNYYPPKDWKCTVDTDGDENDEIKHNHTLDSLIHLAAPLEVISSDVLGNRRRRVVATDTFPNAWSYQVDLYIEVDDDMVNHHGSMEGAIAYINALITSISSVYEKEVDTHLHVLHIAKSNIYDNTYNTNDALNLMKKTYGAETWHYTDPITHKKPDLHHAILHRGLGGGIAYIGGICNSDLGYGVSTGVTGSLSNIGGDFFWDFFIIAHELGHNFGSLHTHDINGYNPRVDGCIQNDANSCKSLNNGMHVSSGDATIMSYCHHCGLGDAIGSTFGGYWHEGAKTDIQNWRNDAGAVPFSVEPRRVPKTMYDFVSSLGSCVAPDLVECTTDNDCNDGNSCTTDTCIDNKCYNDMRDNCCGNGNCEIGPFTVLTPQCNNDCAAPEGMMFDVQANTDIILEKIEFQIYKGNSEINVYTMMGQYQDKATTPSAWTKVISGDVMVSDLSTLRSALPNIHLSAGSFQAFYISTTGALITNTNNNDNPYASDANINLLNGQRAVSATEFGWNYSGVYSWVGRITYSLQDSVFPTTIPTYWPTENLTPIPTTYMPSKVPTSIPTSKRPTTIPTSKRPTKIPTSVPTSKRPTAIPTSKRPSKIPTSVPTSKSPTKTPTTRRPTTTPTTRRPTMTPTTRRPTKTPTTKRPT